MTQTLTRRLDDEAATRALGGAIARALRPGLSLHLTGPLGAGKTTLVRALLRALGERGRVRSPTFTLMETYRCGELDLVHLDLYRFEHPDELVESGFAELMGSDAVTLIEWPERGGERLPAPDIAIALAPADRVPATAGPDDASDTDTARQCTLTAYGARGAALLAAVAAAIPAAARGGAG